MLTAPRSAARQPDGLAPDGSEIRFLAGESEGAGRSSLVEVRLAPGSVSKPVRHRAVEETWYFVLGTGRVWRDLAGEERIDNVSPGDSLVIPSGAAFQFEAGADGLRFTCHTSPPWPGEDEALPVSEGGLGPAQLPPRATG